MHTFIDLIQSIDEKYVTDSIIFLIKKSIHDHKYETEECYNN